MALWLPSGRIRAHEHERGGFSAGARTSDGLKNAHFVALTKLKSNHTQNVKKYRPPHLSLRP